MIFKAKEKQKAIKLRRQGLSYSEILKQVPVAKSTLSLWLRSVGLSKRQKQRLTKKKLISARKGALVKKQKRLLITEKIKKRARGEIGKISKRDLWILGTALYWAEGAKQKEHIVSQSIKLSNSDPRIIKIFIGYLQKICKIPPEDIDFELYIHETGKVKRAKRYWINALDLPKGKLRKVRFKKNKIKTKRRNVGDSYHGLIDIRVRKSTNLNRRIEGWIEGIYRNAGWCNR